MSTLDFQFFTNMDTNPLLVFDHNGKILFLNDSAEILMGYVSASEIYSLAVNNAPQDFGIKNSSIELSYEHINFYAITVGYSSDEWIAIKLYYRPLSRKYSNFSTKQHTITDINKMLHIAINQFTIDNDIDIRIFLDSELPNIFLNQNDFLKLLRKTFATFKYSKHMHITLKLGIGDHILLNGKSYKVINLKIESDKRITTTDRSIDELCNELCVIPNLQKKSVLFDIPLIEKN